MSAKITGRENRVPKSKVAIVDENMADIVCVVVVVKVGESMKRTNVEVGKSSTTDTIYEERGKN